jgi:hypothetical protein
MENKVSNIVIYETTNYDEFKKLVGNREAKSVRVKGIIESIEKVGYQPSPILVNENMEVIDGQGRLEACKALKLPVYYTVKNGIGITECIAMNVKMKNWTIYDFINSYATQGNENYIKLMQVAEEIDGMSIIQTASCMSELTLVHARAALRSGEYELIDTPTTRRCTEHMNRIMPHLNGIKGGAQFYFSVLSSLDKFGLIDTDRMEEAIINYSCNLGSAYNVEDALEKLQDLYNFHKVKKEYFRDRYMVKMRERGAWVYPGEDDEQE